MLSSARISRELAFKSLQCLIEADYQDIETIEEEYLAGADGSFDKRWLHEIPREDCDSFRRIGRLYREGTRYATSERGLHKGSP